MTFAKNLKSETNSANKVLFGINKKMNKELIDLLDEILDDDQFFKKQKMEKLLIALEDLGVFKINKLDQIFYIREYPVLEIKYYDYVYYVTLKIKDDLTLDIPCYELSSDEITVMLQICRSYASLEK